ncbi:Alpha/Beta hydrolase protein [Crassisporium funariophilum]|nr:Alpha/Beta hydrolase protein [Crassisporium funariophilum]
MPHIKIETASGPVLVSYTISTPTSENAQAIDATLPTVLFLHPIYLGHELFHFQFRNPQLRRFNLIGVDARCHGETIGPVPSTFSQSDAADDVSNFMEALRLPPCHFFGLSLGACIALQIAISYPEKVLSIFMLSPLPQEEPEEVACGRQEIYDCWVEGCKDPAHIDQDALLDAVFGALQLAFNGQQSPFTKALVQATLPQSMRNWSSEHFEEFHTVSVKFFTDQKPHSLEALQRVTCPILLVHCGDDIAYPIHFVEDLRRRMEDAGLIVQVTQVPDAAHFGSVTHPDEVNDLFQSWLMEHTKTTVPAANAFVTSPFEHLMKKGGYVEESQVESDDDLFVAVD